VTVPSVGAVILIVAGYLWGSLSPAAFIARRARGIDLSRYGTGNIGATNLGEQLGGAWKIVGILVDGIKGWVPPAVASLLGFQTSSVALVGLATVAGHAWSIWLGFRGGRAIAAAAGVLCAWDVRFIVVVPLVLAVGRATGRAGLTTMIVVLLLAPAAWLLRMPAPIVAGSAALAVLLAVKRLEANGLPLPRDRGDRRAVLWRRLWSDRDLSGDQPWEKRGRF
jgi:acyl phosphate:glycerol-3-phosphate acyltransferase